MSWKIGRREFKREFIGILWLRKPTQNGRETAFWHKPKHTKTK